MPPSDPEITVAEYLKSSRFRACSECTWIGPVVMSGTKRKRNLYAPPCEQISTIELAPFFIHVGTGFKPALLDAG